MSHFISTCCILALWKTLLFSQCLLEFSICSKNKEVMISWSWNALRGHKQLIERLHHFAHLYQNSAVCSFCALSEAEVVFMWSLVSGVEMMQAVQEKSKSGQRWVSWLPEEFKNIASDATPHIITSVCGKIWVEETKKSKLCLFLSHVVLNVHVSTYYDLILLLENFSSRLLLTKIKREVLRKAVVRMTSSVKLVFKSIESFKVLVCFVLTAVKSLQLKTQIKRYQWSTQLSIKCFKALKNRCYNSIQVIKNVN